MLYYYLNHEVEEIISDYEGVIIRSRFEIDSQFIDKSINLKFIDSAGSGLENIDVNYAESKKIKCYNFLREQTAVSEHIGMILSLFNNINISDQEVRKGKWNREKKIEV